MDCRDVTTLAIDRLAGEAGETSRRELSAHLATCESCRAEMARLEDAWAALGTDPDAVLTADFRRRTLGLLEEETMRQRVREFRPRPRLTRLLLQAAALLAAACLGYVAARGLPSARPSAPASAAQTTPSAAALPDLGSNPRLSNVSYRTAGADGSIGIGFDVTTRHELAGRPSAPEVAKLLAYLVSRNAETAGEKSRAIELVSEHFGDSNAPASPEIVAALSSTLRRDANPGVRKKAADVLASFPITPEIRAVFLESLRADKNPAVRLVAVDALAASAKQSPDARTIESLRAKAVDPQENGFVRAKAASALKAISF
ncbi:MAG: HEAT repeat domain-containing protein [Thermoanaerobaculia bacterium]